MEYSLSDFSFIGTKDIFPKSGQGDIVDGYHVALASNGALTSLHASLYFISDSDKAYWLNELQTEDPVNFSMLLVQLGIAGSYPELYQSGGYFVHKVDSASVDASGVLIVVRKTWFEPVDKTKEEVDKTKEEVDKTKDEPKGPDMVARGSVLHLLPAYVAAEFREQLSSKLTQEERMELYSNILEERRELYRNILEDVQDELPDVLVTESEVAEAIDLAISRYIIG